MEIAESFPNPIEVIYIRSIKHEKKLLQIRGLFENCKTVPAVLVETSKEAIEHVREHEFIPLVFWDTVSK